MNPKKTTRILGIAFILQFITSFSNGVFIKPLWFVPDNMEQTLIKIAENSGIYRLGIFLDILTALGVIFLGAVLFITLKPIKKYLSTTAFAFYIFEGTLLAASKIESYKLLLISQDFILNPKYAELLKMAAYSYGSMDYVGNTLHMLIFCIGAMMFYYLLLISAKIPKWISYWGLISLIPLFIGTIAQIFSFSIPFFLYIPYVPFELFIGIWIIVKGIAESE
ncbi:MULTISPECIES: DUF4386 domain-containing protein [unclassified Oceanispirochaeta]|uniref:DUF4386 domain-containing protein n=1 Tax=unclassified Oceanispirochaeta TaxID=2635722 RepID=UPI000E0980E1|nr:MULTISPECIES: DUF4386 domain-containing protein [unclassified Oceanispirochaeta]MBF9015987.1 DUF4386 domain-containing protein [Oceanispirochaeta sp. M2]NPD72450.1 DUF4386 domain-containing protein [Oceanispirochaeta sp. M1]RDG31909.1 DUF4386 domain-containing protein [Oceanispirochaeta sp. M1]